MCNSPQAYGSFSSQRSYIVPSQRNQSNGAAGSLPLSDSQRSFIEQVVKDTVAAVIDSLLLKRLGEVVSREVSKELEKFQQKPSGSGQTHGAITNGLITSSPDVYEYRLITQSEIDSVKSAIPGVMWLACPNNHHYAVGECGNATQSGKCLGCKMPIGRKM